MAHDLSITNVISNIFLIFEALVMVDRDIGKYRLD